VIVDEGIVADGGVVAAVADEVDVADEDFF